MKSKQSKAREFTPKARKEIQERDQGQCIFCRMGYRMDGAGWLDLNVKSIMHYIPRSRNGLGIPENGAVGCQWHHDMMDHCANHGNRKEMLALFAGYLRSKYPEWNEKNLIYKKWR